MADEKIPDNANLPSPENQPENVADPEEVSY